MSKSIADQRRALAQQIADQRRWIETHGTDRTGYIARYGPASGDPTKTVEQGGRYGDGGEVIYAADVDQLRRLLEQDARLLARQNSATNLQVRMQADRAARPAQYRPIDEAAYEQGVKHGRWARQNLPAVNASRPLIGDVVRYGNDWARGYSAGYGKDEVES